MERCHRALRPRGWDGDPAGDTICCLVSYTQKEDILHLARNQGQLQHEGSPIQIFQDLSAITLQHRRVLRPLLNVLRDRHIIYRWKYPFCLAATVGTRTAYLRTPMNLRNFCETLGITEVAVPEWYSTFMHPDPWISTQQGATPRSQHNCQRCRRSTSNSPRRHADDITDRDPRSSPSSTCRKTTH